MDDREEITAMRKLLTLALLGENYLMALDEQDGPEAKVQRDARAERRGWKVHDGGVGGGGVDAKPGELPDILEIGELPVLPLSTALAPEDLQTFFDEGFAEPNPDDPTSIRLTPDGLVRALALNEFFYDMLDGNFAGFMDARFGKPEGPVRAFRLRVALVGCDCWRELIVPDYFDFEQLSDLIQASFNWMGYHLWDFQLGKPGEQLRLIGPGEDFSYPYPDGGGFGFDAGGASGFGGTSVKGPSRPQEAEAVEVLLYELFPSVKRATYCYDYGDGWEHDIRVVETIEDYAGPYPCCTDGSGDAPPEDVGGVVGFERFKKLLAGPDTPERTEMLEWADDQGFQPFDLESVNARIRRW